MTADPEKLERRRISRRSMFGLLGGGAALGAAAGGAGTAAALSARDSGPARSDTSASVPFHGVHQAGVTTAAQDRLHFATFDVHPAATRADLVNLLRRWTAASDDMTSSRDIGSGAVTGSAAAPPDDTGEALGLAASRLTVTAGFGPSLFDGRFGLSGLRPPQLADLPSFAGDALDAARTGGDLCIQACADDPQVAVHAVRNLARIGRGVVSVRYSQLGFGRTSATSTHQATPRNMLGFKDGTANIKAEDAGVVDAHVWVQRGDGPDWMTGGTYLVSRRIRMLIEPWDSTPLTEQERVIGRHKGTGAPLGRSAEFDQVQLSATDASGQPIIDPKAHVRLAHSSHNDGAVLLRRGYSFVDGTDELGRLDAGLFFIAFQRDPRTQFVRIQRSLAGRHNDALNEYIQHVGSGLFACPPGTRIGEYWGQALLS